MKMMHSIWLFDFIYPMTVSVLACGVFKWLLINNYLLPLLILYKYEGTCSSRIVIVNAMHVRKRSNVPCLLTSILTSQV